jgi:hypothetical protein
MRIRMSFGSRAAGVAALATLAHGALLSAQPAADTTFVHVAHGAPSRVFRFIERDGRFEQRDGRSLRIARPLGSNVCLSVQNANPVVFTYNFNAKVDTTFSQLPPEARLALGVLGGFLDVGAKDAAGAQLPKEVTALITAVGTLAADVESLAKATAKAAEPGTLDLTSGVASNHGLLQVQAGIAAIPASAGHLRNDKIVEFLEQQLGAAVGAIDAESAKAVEARDLVDAEAAKVRDELEKLPELPAVGTNPSEEDRARRAALESTRSALGLRQASFGIAKEGYDARLGALGVVRLTLPSFVNEAKQSIAESRRLMQAYDKAAPVYRECAIVKEGLNALTLTFGTKDDYKTPLRNNVPVQVNVASIFQRSRLELYPASFLVRNSDLNTYSIQDQTLVLNDDTNRLNPTLGGVISLTLLDNLDELRHVAISVGAGSSVLGTEGVLKDLMLLTTFSYRDLFRFGAGGGYVPSKQLKPGLGIGLPVPAGSTVDNIVTTERKWEFVMMFSVSGAKLGLGK